VYALLDEPFFFLVRFPKAYSLTHRKRTYLFFVVVGEMRKRNPLAFLKDDEARSTEDATKSDEKRESKVVVIGGGIAGCAVACELHRRGYTKNVLLLEKDESKSSRRQGYGLTISETNMAIEKMNVLNALKRENVLSKQHWTIDARNGDVLGYFGQLFREHLFVSSKSSEPSSSLRRREDDEEEEGNDGRGGEKERKGNLRVPRNVVREILLERIPKENILWNAEVENIEMNVGNSTATITLKKNRHRPTNVLIENCALIVAADGSHSKVQKIRQELYGKEVVPDLKYLGVVLITGFTSLKHYLLNNRGFYAVDGQSRMFTMPFADENKDDNREQKTMWQLSVRCDEEEAKRLYGERESTGFDQIIKQFCMEKTNHWRGVPIAKMFEKTDFSHAWAGPLYDREEPTKIVDDGIIAVIGDASHPMSPFKGQGANTAIEDAWLLCEWLDGPKAPKSLHTALKCFHRESFAKAFKRVRQSREACEIYHDPVKVFRFCENEITSLTKAQSETFCQAMRESRRRKRRKKSGGKEEEEEEEEEEDDDNDDDGSDDDDDDNVDIDERALRVCEELGFSKKHIDSIVEGEEERVRIDDDDDDDGGGAVKHYKLKKQKMKMLLELDLDASS
jgi:2-polyprenyl-6-methoxyphenol hydroxylase-like FAD-dependent oxidoreductase